MKNEIRSDLSGISRWSAPSTIGMPSAAVWMRAEIQSSAPPLGGIKGIYK